MNAILQNTIFTRTEKGTFALAGGSPGIDPWLKHVLRMLDGKRDVGQIGRSVPAGTIDGLVKTLMAQGFINDPGHRDSNEERFIRTEPLDIVPQMASTMAVRAGVARPASTPAEFGPAFAASHGTESAQQAPSPAVNSDVNTVGATTGRFRAFNTDKLYREKLEMVNILVNICGDQGEKLGIRIIGAQRPEDMSWLIAEGEAMVRATLSVEAFGEFTASVRRYRAAIGKV